VICKNTSKKIFEKDFEFVLNLLVFLFKVKKNSNVFWKKESAWLQISLTHQVLAMQSHKQKGFYILFSFLFPLKIGLLNILFILVLDKNFQNYGSCTATRLSWIGSA